MRTVNYAAFTPEEVEQGLHLDLINYLLSYNQKAKENYNDIRISTDSYCTIVEWDTVPYNREYGGRWVWEDEDHELMLVKTMPDHTYQYFFNEKEYESTLKTEYSNWEQNEYGCWYEKQLHPQSDFNDIEEKECVNYERTED